MFILNEKKVKCSLLKKEILKKVEINRTGILFSNKEAYLHVLVPLLELEPEAMPSAEADSDLTGLQSHTHLASSTHRCAHTHPASASPQSCWCVN